MEQYIHTLIAADSAYVPKPTQVVQFFDALVNSSNFHIICNRERFQPGLRVMKPSSRVRTGKNPFTGETISVPVSDAIELKQTSEIPQLIENLLHYNVAASGEWNSGNAPILLYKTDRSAFEENFLCDVSCNLRPGPVSTSAWDVEAGPNVRNVPQFGIPWTGDSMTGIFPNPWTGLVIEVPNASSARFWIEIEFGRFIYPKIAKNLDVLDPRLVVKAEVCFQTKFVQGCRFW